MAEQKITQTTISTDGSLSLAKVPFADLIDPTPETISNLRQICEEVGFFIITDHPVPSALIRRVTGSARNFFCLSEQEKMPYHKSNQVVTPKVQRGYSNKEKLAFDAADRKQIFDLGIHRPLKDGLPYTGPTIMPHDSVAPDFTRSLFEIQDIVMGEMVPRVSQALALALGLDADFFDAYMEDPVLTQRLIYYPARQGFAGKHTDSGLFTLLFQEEGDRIDGHGSLQVATDNSWVGVESHERDVVVNLGDLLQFWSGNRFISTPHRVKHNGKHSRISMPFFLYPNIHTEFQVLEGKDKYKTVRCLDVLNNNFDAIWVKKQGAGRAEEVAKIK